ncbi:MAG: energy transducer TonB [Candidatus Aureabacteria bacterium]|jgi:protein TonB|nr:energy transducer TonB [Candidatus Auribacterota bacterium]NLW94511.1 energy transducer TonB [Chlamydiota bacterium]HOE26176.1 TonB family protein [bacterium]HQM51976.1 TonB family protein [bacterium]
MIGDKRLGAALLLSLLVHAAAFAAGWTARLPAGTAEEEWACAFTVGSVCETAAASPSSAAFIPASPRPVGEAESSRDSDPETDRPRERRLRAAAIAPDAASAPSREEAEGGAAPPAFLASLPSRGNDGRAAMTGGGGRDDYLAAVRRKIATRKRFPSEALNEGQRGTAVVAFRILTDGDVSGVRVVQSSLSPILDAEAGMTVRRAAPFPPPPPRLGPSPLEIRVPISFEIERR